MESQSGVEGKEKRVREKEAQRVEREGESKRKRSRDRETGSKNSRCNGCLINNCR